MTISKPLRVAVYQRVSRAHQDPALQADETKRFIEHRGWTVVRDYVDHGVSGSRDRRPELDRLMADAKKGTFDAVVVYRTDRMARSLRHLVVMLDELGTCSVGFISITEPFDTTSPTGRLLLQVVGAMAEFERSLIIERTRAGIAAARRRGIRVGRPRVRVDLERAAALRRAGLSLRDTAKALGVGVATLSRAMSAPGS